MLKRGYSSLQKVESQTLLSLVFLGRSLGGAVGAAAERLQKRAQNWEGPPQLPPPPGSPAPGAESPRCVLHERGCTANHTTCLQFRENLVARDRKHRQRSSRLLGLFPWPKKATDIPSL